jgi:hypothetical protein
MKPKKGTNFDVSDSSLDRFIPAGGECITTRIQVDFMLVNTCVDSSGSIRLARSERELQYHHAARLGKRSEPSGPKMYSLYSQPPQDKLQRRAHQLLQSCLAHLIPCPHTPHPCLPTNPMTQRLLPRTAASNPSPPNAPNT